MLDLPGGTADDRAEKLAQAKRATLSFARWLEKAQGEQTALIGELRSCGRWLEFREVFAWDPDRPTDVRLAGGKFCHRHLLCRACAIRRGARYLARYVDAFRAEREAGEGRQLHFVTLTVRDGACLVESIGRLLTGWRKQQGRWRKTRAGVRGHRSAWRDVVGGVRSVEVKRGGGSGLWHPHIHAVVVVDGAVDWKSAMEEWRAVTGDPQGVSRWSLLRSERLADPDERQELLGRDLLELFKYVLKFDGLPMRDRWDAHCALIGRHMLHPFGSLWDLELPDSMLDAPLAWDEVEFVTRLFRWSRKAGGYVEHRRAEVDASPWRSLSADDRQDRLAAFWSPEDLETGSASLHQHGQADRRRRAASSPDSRAAAARADRLRSRVAESFRPVGAFLDREAF